MHWQFTCSSRTSICHSSLSVTLLQFVTQLCSLPTVKNYQPLACFSSQLGFFFVLSFDTNTPVLSCFSFILLLVLFSDPLLTVPYLSLPSSPHSLLFLSWIVLFFMYTRISGLFSFQIQFLLFRNFHITSFIVVVHLLHVNTFYFVSFFSFLPVSFYYIWVVHIQPESLSSHKALVPYISCDFGRLSSQMIESSFRRCYKTG